MTSIHTSFGSHGALPHTVSDADLGNARYSSSSIDIISHNIAPGLAASGPLPLPSFVFPAKLSSSISATFSKESGCRPHSVIDLRSDESRNMLDPSFEESSRYSHLAPRNNDSPPISPRTTRTQSGLCEKDTNVLLGEKMDETTIPSCKLPRGNQNTQVAIPASISQRRCHAHRRSAAISSGDLCLILKPPFPRQAGGSLPASPNFEPKSPLLSKSLSSPTDFGTGQDALYEILNSSMKSSKNSRVGFSDDVQIIPRPLSLDSCDSGSTARLTHSVSDSISSVVSASQTIPPRKDGFSKGPLTHDRPRTAESLSDVKTFRTVHHEPKRSGSLPTLLDTMIGSSSDSSIPRSFKRWTLFGNEMSSGSLMPRSRPTSSTSSCYDDKRHEDVVCKPEDQGKNHSASSRETDIARRPSVHKKSNKNQKKVKSWAGSILSHKTKQRNYKYNPSRNPPPAPPRILVTSLTPSPTDSGCLSQKIFNPQPERAYANWKPRKTLPQDDPTSPVIDLDAALGPFNTPISNIKDNSQREWTRKRLMHSAAGLGGFTGPGMHYHRRTESAPEFENPCFGYHRIGSSSTMAMEDVFEEDEDEEWEDTKIYEKANSSTSGLNEDDSDSEMLTDKNYDDEKCWSSEYPAKTTIDKDPPQSTFQPFDEEKSETFISKQSYTKIMPNSTPIYEKISASIEAYEQKLSSRDLNAPQMPVPVAIDKTREDYRPSAKLPSETPELLSPTPRFFQSVTQTEIPSPVSSFSYDTQLISTAPPSIKSDHEFQALLLGEPGPELRISVDDVPSLTSGDSTSNESAIIGENPFKNLVPEVRLRESQRSASFSATIVNRKRSSIASLSRLISSSHGDRSKLALGSRAPSYSEVESPLKPGNLGKRISRIIKFWKKSDISQSSLHAST